MAEAMGLPATTALAAAIWRGGHAERVDERQPFGPSGGVAAQPVDHRDRGGGGAETGCPWPAGVRPAVEEPLAVGERVPDVASQGFRDQEPRRGEVTHLGQQRQVAQLPAPSAGCV
jgi:hypothetical protein